MDPARFTQALRAWAGDGPRRAYADEVASVYAGYRRALDEAGLVDPELFAWRALDALRLEPARWDGAPVFVYGFDDFTVLELDALETLAVHCGAHVVVSLPFEPGREAFRATATVTARLSELAAERIELAAVDDHYDPASRTALHHVERSLFEADPGEPVDAGGAIAFHSAGGARSEVELAAARVLELLRGGTAPGDVAVVFRDPAAYSTLVEQVFGAYGVPYSLDRSVPFAHTGLGRGVLALIRCAGGSGGADDLLAYLRTPGLVKQPALTDRLEAELRQEGATDAERARAIWEGGHWPLTDVDRLRGASDVGAYLDELQAILARLFAGPYKRSAAVLTGPELDDPRVFAAGRDALTELAALADAGAGVDRRRVERVLDALEVHVGDNPQPDRVHVARPEAIRARRFEAVLVLGLQEGEFPGGARPEPFLPDDVRREVAMASGLALPLREDRIDRERYLFYVCASRAERLLVLSSRSSDEEGTPEARSFFLEDVRGLLSGEPELRERSLGEVTWTPDEAPTAAEWDRALAARGPKREEPLPEQIEAAPLLSYLGERGAISASWIERFADCPVKWLVESVLRPDALEPDPEQLVRGQLAHEVLEHTFRRLAEETGRPGVTRANLERAERILLEELERRSSSYRISPSQTRVRAAARRLEFDLLRHLRARGRARRLVRAAQPRASLRRRQGRRPPAGGDRGRPDGQRTDRPGGHRGRHGSRDRLQERQERGQLQGRELGVREPLPGGALHAGRREAAREARGGRRLRGARRQGPAAARDAREGRGRARVGLVRQRPRRGPRVRGEARLGARAHPRDRGRDPRGRAGVQAGLLRLARRLLLPVDLQVRAMSLTPEQQAAVDRRDGSLLVRAGAGTGKTTVLVERFVRAVVDDGVAVDGILAITFTEKAAAEMRTARARALPRARAARGSALRRERVDLDHPRLLRAAAPHPRPGAGIDPEYHVLDEPRVGATRAGRLRVGPRGLPARPRRPRARGRLELMASYTLDGLRDMVRTAYSHLRSRGERRPALPEVEAPRPAGEAARLAAAARAAAAELGASEQATAVTALEKVERCRVLLERVGDSQPAAPTAVDEVGLGAGKAKVLGTPACDEYREALDAYRSLCVDAEHARSHALLRALLELYGDRYERLKRERSGLDFEDLELLARDLLARDEGLRDQLRERYAHVMVDEFQDVNPLQSELIRLVARDNLFRVGDENQSIYGFRHADVEVFRRHRDQAAEEGRALGVTVNFRSRGELMDAVALGFERLWGEGYEPLREAPGARDPAPDRPLVDLLVVDGHKGRWDDALPPEDRALGAAMAGVAPWRALEARLLAKRIDELTGDDGPYEFRDVVVLLRATTSMSVYERALVERGIPTHVVGGRGYWSQQQVSDLRHWLTALANPLDELALYSVLASPLAGLALDSVALVALHAREARKDPMWALREGVTGAEGGLAEVLPPADLARARAFLERFDAERAAAPRVALETLIDRAVTKTGYDRHLLALPAGERRMANVRKLMRMAREYEADEGRDLRGFIDAIADRDVLQEREGEAPLEAETLDAVRLMTIHRAKGLEFPVVAVGDLGKIGREDDGRLRISNDGTTGMRLASMGGGAVSSSELDRIKAEQKVEAEAEEQRIFYVAATRAERHLILSGATDLEKLPAPSELCEPMRWVWRHFCAGLPGEGASGECVDERDGREVRVAWRRLTPATLPELLAPEDLAPAAAAATEPAEAAQQAELELAAVPAPRALPVSRLSYSGLEAYRRCSYRFYLERSLRLRPRRPAGRAAAALSAGPDAAAAREPRAPHARGARLRQSACRRMPRRWRR